MTAPVRFPRAVAPAVDGEIVSSAADATARVREGLIGSLIRRAIGGTGGRAACVAVYPEPGGRDPIVLLSIEPEAAEDSARRAADVEAMAREIREAIEMDSEGGTGAAAYTVKVLDGEGAQLAGRVITVRRASPTEQRRSETLRHHGEPMEAAIVRQLMRHTELLTEAVLKTDDARGRAQIQTIEAQAKRIAALEAQNEAQAGKTIERMRLEHELGKEVFEAERRARHEDELIKLATPHLPQLLRVVSRKLGAPEPAPPPPPPAPAPAPGARAPKRKRGKKAAADAAIAALVRQTREHVSTVAEFMDPADGAALLAAWDAHNPNPSDERLREPKK